ncbi:hypothetical protein FQR65_LT19534 [Abscondita terminalis]|nr:hypothetical protein FQR65_LT19534 [Abscondita terminalis]
MARKTGAEQEIGFALLQEVVAYAETSMSRRKFLLHYFGEEFDSETGEGADMDDTVSLAAVPICGALLDGSDSSGFGMTVISSKDIETYGILKLTEKGADFIKNPTSFMMSEDHDYNESEDESIVTSAKISGVLAMRKSFHVLEKEKPRNTVKILFELNWPICGRRYYPSDDLVLKSTGANSALKLGKGLDMDVFAKGKWKQIVYSGTKTEYQILDDDILDEDNRKKSMNI